MNEEYIDNVKHLIEQKDADKVKGLLIDLHPADIAELCNDLNAEEAKFVYRLLDMFKPDCMSIEKLYFTNNKTTGIDVAQARGIILLTAVQRDIEIYEYKIGRASCRERV